MGTQSEQDVGITEFLNPDLLPVPGRLKDRVNDFQVHEVSTDGVELHLDELITPGAINAQLREAAANKKSELEANTGQNFAFSGEQKEQVTAALGEEGTEKLQAFLRRQASSAPATATGDGGEEGPPPFVDIGPVGDGSKDARRKAHQTVKQLFGSFLNTEAVSGKEDGCQLVRIWMQTAEKKLKLSEKGESSGKQSEASKGGKADRKGGKGKGGKGKGKKGKGKGAEDATPADKVEKSEFGDLRSEGWPKDRPDYLRFRLYKENCTTAEAIGAISKCTGRSAKQFSFAGTKDKRAVTCQHITAHRLPIDHLKKALCHRQWDKRLRVSSLSYVESPLHLGDLQGNGFYIVLRGLAPAEKLAADIDAAFLSLKDQGFLNYFGLQRFGTGEVPTHRVGAAIIAGRWQEAANLILGNTGEVVGQGLKRSSEDPHPSEPAAKKPRQEEDATPLEDEDEEALAVHASMEDADHVVAGSKSKSESEVAKALSIFKSTGDAQKALDAMPRSQHIERTVLGAIARGLDFRAVLQQLPYQSRSLYAHAAQSLLWNRVVSERITKFGRAPQRGDLVIEGDTAPGQLPTVRELVEEELGRFSLQDVVLPLPGSDVQYPSYLRQSYDDLAQELLSLSILDFHHSDLVELPGAYRAMVVKPKNLTWRYVTPDEAAKAGKDGRPALLPTDVARLLAQREAAAVAGAAPDGEPPAAVDEAAKAEQADSLMDAESAAVPSPGEAAVAFSCQLPTSAYLTSFMREMTRGSQPAKQASSHS